MSYQVIIHPEAAREAELAYRFIAERSPLNAARWYDRLLEAMFSLAEFPGRCPSAPEKQYLKCEIRHLLYGNYRILYTVDKPRKVVRVLHIRHGAMRPLGYDADENE